MPIQAPPYVTRGYGVKIPKDSRIIIPTSATVFDEDGNEIGLITEVSYTTGRTVERVRHINHSDAGRIVEQVPGVEDPELSVVGYALYGSGIMGRLYKTADSGQSNGIMPPDVFRVLSQQYIPFDIEVVEQHPTTGDAVITLYIGCWISSFEHAVRIGDVTIAETVRIQPSAVEVTIGSNKTSEPQEGAGKSG